MAGWRTVTATREGLVGQKTSTGYIIDTVVPYVALPSEAAKYQPVLVSANGTIMRAIVLDTGPHHTNDNAYVFQGARPQAETDRPNKAGIDLGEVVWNGLGMKDNGPVSWKFEWEE